eukprot:1184004-Prorocentrum_minimum.AAC.2
MASAMMSLNMAKSVTQSLSASHSIKGSAPLRFAAPRRQIAARGRLQVVNLSSNDLKNGMSILVDGTPYRVIEFLHVKPGKGSAFVRSKLKNYLTGNSVEKTFRAGEKLEAADMEKVQMQYTYKDGSDFVMMDMITYEETRLLEDETWSKYLKEGMQVDVLKFNNKVIDVMLPLTVTLAVADTDPGEKGNTAQGGSKPATMETGAVIQVPLFVNIGDLLDIDTRDHKYLKRSG